MANDYIRREDAVDAFADYIKNVDKVYSTGKLTHDDCIDCAESVLDGLSSADVAPVVHSEWIYHMSYGVCKKCNYEYEWKGTDAKNYCPNCGAKMNKGEVLV